MFLHGRRDSTALVAVVNVCGLSLGKEEGDDDDDDDDDDDGDVDDIVLSHLHTRI